MCTIVVVEDSPTQTLRTSLALRKGGYTVICAIDGHDGLEKTFWHRPEVVVLDVNLPDMNGFDICRLLKEDRRSKQVTVIMYTADHSVSNLVHTREAGADYCVFKGNTGDEELLSHIKEAIKQTS